MDHSIRTIVLNMLDCCATSGEAGFWLGEVFMPMDMLSAAHPRGRKLYGNTIRDIITLS